MFAVDGTARGSGRACPLRVRGAGSEWCGCGRPRPRRGARRAQVPSAAADRRVRPHLPAAGSAACDEHAQARPRRRRCAHAPRPRGTPAPRGRTATGAAAEVRRDPSGACASYSTTSDFCVPCVFVQSTTSTALSSSRTAGRGELASAGWGAGRGREPGAARD
jgi:hypothetical protein